jgi:nucleoid-associated protein YgaU
VLIIALVLVGFVLVSLGRAATEAIAADPSVPQSGVSTTEWVVQPGDTLWTIAETVAPDTDPRDMIARIVQLNDLPDSSVQAGQTLRIPA